MRTVLGLVRGLVVFVGMCAVGADLLAQPGGPGGGPGGPGGGFGGPGGFGGRRGGMRFGPPPADPDALMTSVLFSQDFREAIELTDDQEAQLRDLWREYGDMMRELPEDASEDDRKAKFRELDKKAQALLTPEQKATYEQFRPELAKQAEERRKEFEERRAQFERMRNEGGGRPPEGGGPPGPPGPPRGPRGPRPQAAPEAPPPDGTDVTASFAANSAAAAARSADGDEPTLSFNFRYAPWTEVLKMFAEVCGLTLDLNDVPPGTFNYYDKRVYTATEALDVLNGYLIQKGYILVRRDQFLVVVNFDEDSVPPNLVPVITAEELPSRGKNELVSLVIPLEGVEADKVVNDMRELVGPQGKITALKNTNALSVTDIGSNVRRIYDILKGPGLPDSRETAFKTIPLKHISAAEAERMVRRLFGLNPVTSVTSTAQPTFGFPGPFGGPPGFGGPFGSPFGSSFGSRDGRDGRDSRDGRDGRGSDTQTSTSSRSSGTTQQSPFAGKIQVTADTRTNNLMVAATPAHIKLVEEYVKSLDTDTDANGNKISATDSPVSLKVYNVAGGDATQIARTLSLMMPGLAIIDDPRTAKLHVQGTDDEHREVSKLLRELTGDASSSVAVLTLHRLDPVSAANTLRNLFAPEQSRAPSIEANVAGRQLMVRGTPDQVAQVKALLVQLGEIADPNAAQDATGRGPVRRLMLNQRDPQELLPLFRQASPAPIRIVVPSQPNPIRDRRVPSQTSIPEVRESRQEQPTPAADDRRTQAVAPPIRSASLVRALEEEFGGADQAAEPESPRAAGAPPRALGPGRRPGAATPADPFDAYLQSFLDEPAATQPGAPAAEAAPADAAMTEEGPAPISLTVVGDELILTSKDEAALDQAERLFEELLAAIPARTRWTVFYLRTADATETAQMLERLFPQSSVTASTQTSDGILGSLAGGLSSFGRGMMNVTGLNQTLGGGGLRIVTDIRANALFVTGPADKIAEIESMLQILDASELPESLRDRLPRSIAVEYADVDEVAAVVENVFKDSMTPEVAQGAGGRGFNPLAMLMGQQAGAQGKGPRGVELTLGVDKKTSHLIVSCNDALFRQIEQLVQNLDQRAKESRQVVRVMPLATADPLLVSSTITSLMPKVTVSATRAAPRQRSARGGESGGESNRGNNGAQAAPDATRDPELLRRVMEQQMRSQSSGGEGRGFPFGGRDSGGDRGDRGGFRGGFPGGFPGFPGFGRGESR